MPCNGVPHYDPDARRWMVQVDRFVARPATERETYEAVKAYLAEAVRHGCERLGADVAEDVIEQAMGVR